MQERKTELIDLKGKFAEYFMKWTLEHRDETEKEDRDEQELYYELYDRWMNEKDPDLGGRSPGEYFDDVSDKRLLLSALIDYLREGIPVPDPLLNSIVKYGDETYPLILSILMDNNVYEDLSPENMDDLRAECISLIWDMKKEHPYLRYAELLLKQEEDSNLADILCEALRDRKGEILDRLVEGYGSAGRYARTCIIEILAMAKDDRGRELIMQELSEKELDKLFLCSKLMEYNDRDAEMVIKKELSDPGNDYYTYRELRNMYEELTGEDLGNEDFSGDPTYELEKYIFKEDAKDEK